MATLTVRNVSTKVVKSLKALDDEGSIELYSSTVVVKTADGSMSIKDSRHPRGPWGTMLGVSAGALIGLLAALCVLYLGFVRRHYSGPQWSHPES